MLINKWIGTIGLSMLSMVSVHAGFLKNFNDPNTPHLLNALKNQSLHVVQLGDSHTAADHMTHALRTTLQTTLGNGGLGWAMPMYFTGQRMALYGYDNNGWQPVSSRSQHQENYTLGGFIAKPLYDQAKLTLKPKQETPLQEFTVSIRQDAQDGKFTGIDARGQTFEIEAPIKNNMWQTTTFTAQLPFTITSQQAQHSVIGGWWAKNQQPRGAIVSALGINGAELSFWNRWNDRAIQQELAIIQPELMILAYGTNEAFNQALEIDTAKSMLIQRIRQIRQASPRTAILIASSPEALKQTAGECGTRPSKLTAIQNMQYQVAQNEKTLFWDWQAAMGGQCSMKKWINQGLAVKDGVHFSLAGYQKLGQTLADDILNLSDNVATNNRSTPVYSPNTTTSTGYAKICLDGSNECKSINF